MLHPLGSRLEQAVQASRESVHVDFKREFDIESTGEWCELIKDIVAMANSGGGVILIGVEDNGTLSGFNPEPVIAYDLAKYDDKLSKYVERNVVSFLVVRVMRDGSPVAAIIIEPAESPILFAAAGTYEYKSKPKCAFNEGTAYFRHGAKSRPGTTNDVRKFIEKILKHHRQDLMQGVRRMVVAPKGNRGRRDLNTVQEIASNDLSSPLTVRITDDPNAPVFRSVSPDSTHPYRLKELLPEIERISDGQIKLTTNLFTCIRKIYDLDNNPVFVYKSQHSARQYSPNLIEWIMQKYENDSEFFNDAKRLCYERRNELGLVNQYTKISG